MNPCPMCILAEIFGILVLAMPGTIQLHVLSTEVQWGLGRSRPPPVGSDAFDSLPEEAWFAKADVGQCGFKMAQEKEMLFVTQIHPRLMKKIFNSEADVLIAPRIVHPKQVWLNRGNHEDRQQNLRTTKIGGDGVAATESSCE